MKRLEKPRIVTIEKNVAEADTAVSFHFSDELCARATPGQFVMVWIPGIDEIPMSLSAIGELSRITVCCVGDATTALGSFKKGDRIGIRGPYGRGFSLKGTHPACIGGGMGIAPLMPLIDEAVAAGRVPAVFSGARTKGGLFFNKELTQRAKSGELTLAVTTDDGSAGVPGFITQHFDEVLGRDTSIDQAYTCGPEPMMHALYVIARRHHVPLQASLERYMKCGFGICGQCSVDSSGIRVCKEGPVFDDRALARIDEFGRYARDAAGVRKPYKKL